MRESTLLAAFLPLPDHRRHVMQKYRMPMPWMAVMAAAGCHREPLGLSPGSMRGTNFSHAELMRHSWKTTAPVCSTPSLILEMMLHVICMFATWRWGAVRTCYSEIAEASLYALVKSDSVCLAQHSFASTGCSMIVKLYFPCLRCVQICFDSIRI